MDTISLSELNNYIRRVIALNFSDNFWVHAEIAQVKLSRQHYYIEFIEQDPVTNDLLAQSSAVIWAKDWDAILKKRGNDLKDILKQGVEVMIYAGVDFHERYGLKLIIKDIDPAYTLGQLELNKKKILDRLTEQNLLYKNGLISIPHVLQKIAVISSDTSAGLKDFMTQLSENPQQYSFHIDLYSAAVQGGNAAPEIIRQLESINRSGQTYDCIVIIRGGGSKIDLSAFDDYALGEAIAHASSPVFTGIGHEIDQSIADIVAAKAFKTPTAVAAHIIDQNTLFEHKISEIYQSIMAYSDILAKNEGQKIQLIEKQLRSQLKLYLQKNDIELTNLTRWVRDKFAQHLQQENFTLEKNEMRITASDPKTIMKKGYSVTLAGDRIITDVRDISEGQVITTKYYNGESKSEVVSKTE